METKQINTNQLYYALKSSQSKLIKDLLLEKNLPMMSLLSLLQVHNNSSTDFKKVISQPIKKGHKEYSLPCAYRGIFIRLICSKPDLLRICDLRINQGDYDLTDIINDIIVFSNREGFSFSPYVLHAMLGITVSKVEKGFRFNDIINPDTPYKVQLNVIQARSVWVFRALIKSYGIKIAFYHLDAIAHKEQSKVARRKLAMDLPNRIII